MLNPSLIVDAVVSTLQTIPPLVTAMNGDPTRIAAFHYLYGPNVPLEKAIYEMLAPSILIVFDKTQPGNFNGCTIWKQHICGYVRAANTAANVAPVSYEQLWWLIVNSPVNGGTQNIRSVNVLPRLQIMDTPSITRGADADGIDWFRFNFVFPELGDT
jgi:hypothetical protein